MDARDQALAEKAFCEQILAKGGLTVLTETFAGVDEINAWDHYPQGDVLDPVSGAQWFYHCHPAEEVLDTAEHGHFHLFLRPQGDKGPVHHLIALGMDAHGRLIRLFTVNHWVVGGDWLAAEDTIALLARFDVQMPKPNYLVNRWLTAVVSAYDAQIADLIRARDAALQGRGDGVFEDRQIEVTSELRLDDHA